jgi:hypothetical protein
VQCIVNRAASGTWAVCKSGFEEPIALFRDKRDAVDYADRLAATKPAAEVEASEYAQRLTCEFR